MQGQVQELGIAQHCSSNSWFRVETRDEMQMLQLCQKFYEMYPGLKNEWDTVEEWIAMQFNSIHTQTFSNRPYYHYEGGMFTRKI